MLTFRSILLLIFYCLKANARTVFNSTIRFLSLSFISDFHCLKANARTVFKFDDFFFIFFVVVKTAFFIFRSRKNGFYTEGSVFSIPLTNMLDFLAFGMFLLRF